MVLTGEDLAAVTIGTRSNKKQSLDPSDSAEDTWNVVETDVFDIRRRELGPQQRTSALLIEEDR